MRFKSKDITRFILTGLFSCFLFLSCSEDKIEREPEMESDSDPLTISAGISKTVQARNNYGNNGQDYGQVTNGTYYLTYTPANNNGYTVASVNFGTEGRDPQIGWVNTASGSQFKWNEVGGGSTPTFYLDNVVPQPTTSTSTDVTFSNDYNPFIANPYDSIDFKNDLLWGTLQVGRNTTGTLMFDLHHYMSRIQVKVTLNRENFPDGNDMEIESIELTNIITDPQSFNRLDGTLTLGNSFPQDYSNLTLFDSSTTWNVNGTSTEGSVSTYLTQSFVVPPQGLLEDANRPRLNITLTNGKLYSGILPYAMIIEGSQYDNPYPVTLYFLKEYLLTINTTISNDPPELAFMPVQVIEWVWKGEYNLEGHQSGIYTANEFYNLIKYYQSGNDYQLIRYGYISSNNNENSWTFDFWSSVILDFNTIYDQMSSSDPALVVQNFSFNFNGYTISVQNGTTVKQVNAQQLYQIVTGKQGFNDI